MSNLKDIREKKGIKLQAVANHVGVCRQVYAGYEKDPSKMTMARALKACEFLGCTLNDIFLPTNVSDTYQTVTEVTA